MTEHVRLNVADGGEILSEQDARDVLIDVGTTHPDAAAFSQRPDEHLAIVGILQRILAGKGRSVLATRPMSSKKALSISATVHRKDVCAWPKS